MVTEEVDVIAHFDADTERSQMGSIEANISTIGSKTQNPEEP